VAELYDVIEFLEALRLPGDETGEELLPNPPPELMALVLLGLDLNRINERGESLC
jgi:hypothetical protein